MTAGDLPHVLAFVYASDDAIPIQCQSGVADPLYYPGLMRGRYIASQFVKEYEFVTYYKANNANPAGVIVKKYILSVVQYTVIMVDAVPWYLVLGKATATADYLIQGAPDGDVPECIYHKENNLMNNEQAREYSGCKHVKGVLKLVAIEDDAVFLGMELTAIGLREYDMTTDSVVQTHNPPILRGDASPAQGYKIRGNTGITTTWNSKSVGNYLNDINFTVENAHSPAFVEDGNDYPAAIAHDGERKYSDLVLTLVQVDEASDEDDMEQYVDGSTKSDVVIKVPRRHANDYQQITFKNAYLKKYDIKPAPSDIDGPRLIQAVFTGMTDVEVVEKVYTAAGASDPNAAATYEL